MWILLLQGHPEEHFNPTVGLSRWGCYRSTSGLGSLMWFGRTWRGRAGPKVISRTVTSEIHFPTIKERERETIRTKHHPFPQHWVKHLHVCARCVCLCACVWALPLYHNHSQTLADSFPILNNNSKVPIVFTRKESHLPRNWEKSRRMLKD